MKEKKSSVRVWLSKDVYALTERLAGDHSVDEFVANLILLKTGR